MTENTVRITARFDSREDASHAAAELRRSGVEHSLRAITVPGEDGGGAINMAPVAELYGTNITLPGPGDALMSYRGFTELSANHMSDAMLTVRVRASQSGKAKRIISDCGGRELRG